MSISVNRIGTSYLKILAIVRVAHHYSLLIAGQPMFLVITHLPSAFTSSQDHPHIHPIILSYLIFVSVSCRPLIYLHIIGTLNYNLTFLAPSSFNCRARQHYNGSSVGAGPFISRHTRGTKYITCLSLEVNINMQKFQYIWFLLEMDCYMIAYGDNHIIGSHHSLNLTEYRLYPKRFDGLSFPF